jgi:uncharacterized iron-regulated membrane protein
LSHSSIRTLTIARRTRTCVPAAPPSSAPRTHPSRRSLVRARQAVSARRSLAQAHARIGITPPPSPAGRAHPHHAALARASAPRRPRASAATTSAATLSAATTSAATSSAAVAATDRRRPNCRREPPPRSSRPSSAAARPQTSRESEYMLRVSCLRVVSPAACRRVWSVGLVAVCPRDNPVSCALHRGPARWFRDEGRRRAWAAVHRFGRVMCLAGRLLLQLSVLAFLAVVLRG